MLSIVVPTYRQAPRLRLALASLTRACVAEDVAAEIIVVDDAGEPEVEAIVGAIVAALADDRVELRVIAGDHGGRSVARNRGARAARGTRVLFCDGDVLIAPGSLRAHARLAAERTPGLTRGAILRMPWLAAFSDPATGALTATAAAAFGEGAPPALATRTIELDRDGYAASARLARTNQFERDIQALLATSAAGRWLGATGAHLSIDREALLALGGFDEQMGLRWGAEDLELGFRIEASGLPIAHVRDAAVAHMDHETAGRDGDHASALAYFARKHDRPEVLRLLDYFEGRCALAEVARA